MRRALHRSTLLLVVASGLAAACGHLPFDDLPEASGDGLDASALDAGRDGAFLADGNVGADARDGSDIEDAPADRNVVDACADCGVIFVSMKAGKPDNPGTADQPVDSISGAFALVSSLRTEIRVAAGSYKAVTVTKNVVLRGGYLCDQLPCAWAPPSPSANDTVIDAIDFAGALQFGPAITRETVVDGFHLRGKQGAIDVANTVGATTVAILGATPTIQHCVIEGAKATGGNLTTSRRSSAVLISGPSNKTEGPLIDNCTITGGLADFQAIGVLVENAIGAAPSVVPPNVEIANCKISGGGAPTSVGIIVNASNTATLIHDNAIQATPSNSAGATNAQSWGIILNGVATIERNRINLGTRAADGDYCKSPKAFCGGIELNSAVATIWNNVIAGLPATNSAAVLIGSSDDKDLGSVNLNSNFLDGTGNALAASVSAAVVLKNTNPASNVLGEVRNNIMLPGRGKNAYAVYEDDMGAVTSHLKVLEYNDLAAPLIYREYVIGGVAKEYTFAQIDSIPVTTRTHDLNADCPVDTGFHLTTDQSPCDGAGTSTKAPSVDFDTPPDPRPLHGQNDIGADERK